jgi:dTDP-L-rhamnose 4-epimerase
VKVLVTGGAGFIGSHVVDALCARGDSVIVVDSLDPGVFRAPPDYLNPRADYCFADLRQWIPDGRFADVEGIIHLAALGGVSRAAKEPANVITANCGGTARLREIAGGWKQLRKFVLAGSFSVYGSGYRYRCDRCEVTRDAQRDESDLLAGRFEVNCRKCGEPCRILPITSRASPAPLETYAASKYMQELCLLGFQCDITVLRFSSVYGARLRLDDGEATIIAKLAGWIRDGTSPTLYEDGRQIRDWVYVGDLVAAILKLVDGGAGPGRTLNVCSGEATTLIEACTLIAAAMGRPVNPNVVGGFRPGDMRHCLGDAGELAGLIGRAPMAFSQGAQLVFGRAGKV